MRVVLCEDHRLLLEALAGAIAARGHTVEAATSTPGEAAAAVRLYEPDIVLLDLNFPDGSGLDVARLVLAHHPGTKVVVLTASDDLATLREALELGVNGYLRKDRRLASIVDAIERVRQDETAIDDLLLRRLSRSRPPIPSRRTALDDLTGRERDILDLLAEGLNTAQIVLTLGISSSTVRSHIQSILSKLGVHSRLQAVALLSGTNGVQPSILSPDGRSIEDG